MQVTAVRTQETIEVKAASVGCDGGKGRFGHPMVYLNVAAKGEVTCPYCSRHYVLAKDAQVGHGH